MTAPSLAMERHRLWVKPRVTPNRGFRIALPPIKAVVCPPAVRVSASVGMEGSSVRAESLPSPVLLQRVPTPFWLG